jgi:hypothetical protein
MLKLRYALAVLLTGSLAFAAVRPVLFEEMAMPKPTTEHAELQKCVGTWEGTVTMYAPGMPQTPSPAKEVVTAAGPFWTTSHFTSDFMGMTYEGRGCHGYDPQKGKFTSTWIDNMSSYLSVMEGEMDAETGMLVSHWDAPTMTGEMAPHRSENKFSGDAYTMTFYTEDVKIMVIDMKRTK